MTWRQSGEREGSASFGRFWARGRAFIVAVDAGCQRDAPETEAFIVVLRADGYFAEVTRVIAPVSSHSITGTLGQDDRSQVNVLNRLWVARYGYLCCRNKMPRRQDAPFMSGDCEVFGTGRLGNIRAALGRLWISRLPSLDVDGRPELNSVAVCDEGMQRLHVRVLGPSCARKSSLWR